MKLNHLNLVVSNVAASIALFETYFGFRCTEIKGDNVIAVLKGTDDFTLVLMMNKEGSVLYPKAFHLGFMLAEAPSVTEIYEQLRSGGIAVGEPPKTIRDSFGFYFTFDMLMIEVGHYVDSSN